MTPDPLTLAVVKGSLEEVVEEMDRIVERAAFSPVISQARDRASGRGSAGRRAGLAGVRAAGTVTACDTCGVCSPEW